MRPVSPPGRWASYLALLSSLALLFTDRTFAVLARVFLASHLPVALIEGLVTGSVVVLLRQVRPEILRARHLPARFERWPMGKYALPLLFFLMPAPALAHKLNIFAQAEGTTIAGRVYFTGDIPARQVRRRRPRSVGP